MDRHHRRAHAHARHLGLEGAFELAVEVRDVSRGAAHVEADDLVEARHGAGAHGADDAARRPREDGVLALEEPGVGEAAVRLHEQEARIAGFGRHAVDIAAQDGRQVGVDHGGVATADDLHQRTDLVRDRNLREPDPARDTRDRGLVRRIAVAVHEDDGGGAETVIERGLEIGAGRRGIERGEHLALGAHPFVHFDDALVKLFRQNDVKLEQLGPVLVGDAQYIAQALGDDE